MQEKLEKARVIPLFLRAIFLVKSQNVVLDSVTSRFLDSHYCICNKYSQNWFWGTLLGN